MKTQESRQENLSNPRLPKTISFLWADWLLSLPGMFLEYFFFQSFLFYDPLNLIRIACTIMDGELWIFCWSMGNLPVDATFMKTVSVSWRNHWLPIVPLGRAGLMSPSFSHEGIDDLSMWRLPEPLWFHEHYGHVKSPRRQCFTVLFPHFLLIYSFCPVFCNDLLALEGIQMCCLDLSISVTRAQ